MARVIDLRDDPYFLLASIRSSYYPLGTQFFRAEMLFLTLSDSTTSSPFLQCNHTCLASPQYLTFPFKLEALNHISPPCEMMLENSIAILSFPCLLMSSGLLTEALSIYELPASSFSWNNSCSQMNLK